MRKLLLSILILSFIGCAPNEKWTKDAVQNKCLGDFNKRNDEEKKFNSFQIGQLCDCIAEKMTTKYKSSKEADKDEEGSKQMGMDCAMEVMKK